MSSQHHKLYYGSQIIPFDLEYRKRKTLEINVYPDMSVIVKAPLNRTYDEIEEKLKKRASWIVEQRYFFSLFLPKQPPKKYISGESFFYLGKQYRLKTIESKNERIMLKRGFIDVYTKSKNNPLRIKKQLDNWYKQRALIRCTDRLNVCFSKIKKYNIPLPILQIKQMKSRWGSCSKKRDIILNTHLIKAPSQCIDYVIVHEICHLKYFNHGRAFYNLLVNIMPDWEKRKKRLETIIL